MDTHNVDKSADIRKTHKLHQSLFTQIDASSLAVFRIGFGLIMFWEVIRYWTKGWISRYYINPDFHFKYYGFDWIEPWAGEGMYIHFIALGILAIFITIGFMYRISIILFTIAFCYVFLLDQARYLNHFYLVIIFSSILMVVPANRVFSVDARLRRKMRNEKIPAWSVWLLRIQMEIILIHAGIVKINLDWLQLQPLSMWLAKRSDLPIFGPLFTQDWAVAFAAYGVIILHLAGAPLLLWRTTRLYVFFIYLAFHILNHFVFSIGIFPWFTLFATLLFFDPDWPKQFSAWIRNLRNKSKTGKSESDLQTELPVSVNENATRYWVYSFLGIWILVQVFLPLRHWLYPGNVAWTEQGHLFSWRMKLRSKSAKVLFYVTDPSNNKTTIINPNQFLKRRQIRKMAARPDMILQFAHYLRDNWAAKQGIINPIVRADAIASLNGRKVARLIDKSRNLAEVERDMSHADWIQALKIPLNDQRTY